MAKELQQLILEVATLSRQDRLNLVRLLLELDQLETSRDVGRVRDEEIRARVKAADDGRVVGISYE
jgi:hypothetical protein